MALMTTIEAPTFTLRAMSSRPRQWGASRRESDMPNGRSRVYVSIDGETLLKHLYERTSRPHNIWKPMVIAALQAAGVQFDGLAWSQRCGCSCPCSAGFILKNAPVRGMDYFVYLTVEGDI